MSKVVRKDVDKLNATITVTVAKADYEPKFKTELSKYRKKAQIKGFRKGKTPMGFIKKMYGKAVLAEVVNEMLQQEVSNYLTNEKIDILGQPLPSHQEEPIDFDVKALEDFEFQFDLGIAPEFEVQGASEATAMERYKVEVSQKQIDEDLNNARKRIGKQVKVEEGIQEGDLINFNVEELEGDQLKENGWAANFSILYDKIAKEELKKELSSKKVGESLRFNVYELEEGAEEDHVRKYLLDIKEEETQEIGAFFEGTIQEISRVDLADLDQEFFDKYFGEGEVSSIEEANLKIADGYKDFYGNQADALLFRDLREKLQADNKMSLPDEFLKRWLKTSSEKNTDEIVERDYEAFAGNLSWTLVRNKLIKQFELQISEQDLREGFANRIKSYYGAYITDDMIQGTIDKLLEDQKQVEQLADELITDKLFTELKGKISIVDKEIPSEEFDEILKKAKEEAEAARNFEADSDVSDHSEEEEEEE